MRARRLVSLGAACSVLASSLVGLVGFSGLVAGAQAAQLPMEPPARVVSADPANNTPRILNGRANVIVEIGNKMIVGGTFTQVQAWNAGPVLTRNQIFAFDKTTGAIDPNFVPTVNGEVAALAPAGDGQSVLVGGLMSQINGLNRKISKLRVSDGATVAGFVPPAFNGGIKDLKVSGGQIYVAGQFTLANAATRTSLASLNATTGALTSTLAPTVADTFRGGTLRVDKIDVNPQGDRLVAIGNFRTVNGLPRVQVAMFSLPSGEVTPDWRIRGYEQYCSASYNTYMRDLDFSPDGTYLVITTTGAYGGSTSLCDSAARFPTYASSDNLQPDWANLTGGDTLYAVAVTEGAVYIGGHQRWVNNPYAGDRAGAGAIVREGIAALDPVNGMPLSWNPGRTRGVGVFDLLVTSQGLWGVSDTDLWAGEYHPRLALFPLTSGGVQPAMKSGLLPNDVYLLGNSTSSTPDGRRVFFDGVATEAQSLVSGGVDWSRARGAVMIDGTLYTPWSDGTFLARSFDGTTFGTATVVNLFGGNFASDAPSIRAMFWDPATRRMYYTMAGQNTLYYRYFSTEFPTAGAYKFAVSGDVSALNPSQVRGMFLSGSQLYFADAVTGALHRVGFASGAVTGPAVTVDTTMDWRSRASFIWNGTAAPRAPKASFTSSVSYLTGSFDASTSTDPDGTIASYSWDFGDGTTGTGVAPQHGYAAAGTYAVSLTVTDATGLTAATTGSITTVANALPTATFTSTCDVATCTFDASGSTDPEGGPLTYAWEFGDLSAGTGATPSHNYNLGGDYPVTLTVTDDGGATASYTALVTATDPPNTDPVAGFTQSCTYLACSFDAATSADPDGTIADYFWEFGDGSAGAGVDPDHVYGAAGTYPVTLTVTDNRGGTATTSGSVTVTAAPQYATIGVRGQAATTGNATSFSVTVPASVQAGDQLVYVVSNNTTADPSSVPAGFVLVDEQTSNQTQPDLQTRVYVRTAPAGIAGTPLTVAFPSITKAEIALVAYSGVDSGAPISALASTTVAGTSAAHTTPAVPVASFGSWVVSFCTDMSTVTTTSWIVPGGVCVGRTNTGAGSGRVSILLTDSGGPVAAGTRAGLTATASSVASKATMTSLVLRPARIG